MNGVIGGRQQGWPRSHRGRIPDSHDGRGRPGQRHEAHALNQSLVGHDPLVEDPGAQIEDPLRCPALHLAQLEGDGAGEQVGIGSLAVVDAGGYDPRVSVGSWSQSSAAHPHPSIGKSQQRFLDLRLLDIVVIGVDGPQRLVGNLGEGPPTSTPGLIAEHLARSRRPTGEWSHPGPRRALAAVDENDGYLAHVGIDDRSRSVRHSQQPVHDEQDDLRVDAPAPELLEHAECDISRVDRCDVHRCAFDNHSWVFEPASASRLGRELDEVWYSPEAVGAQKRFEFRGGRSARTFVPKLDAYLRGTRLAGECRRRHSEPEQSLGKMSPGLIDRLEIRFA